MATPPPKPTARTPSRRSVALLALLSWGSASCGLVTEMPEYPVLIPGNTAVFQRGLAIDSEDTDSGRRKQGRIDHSNNPDHPMVQLWAYDSHYARTFGMHPYFLCYDPATDRWERWEVFAGDQFGTYVNEQTARISFGDPTKNVEETFRHRQWGSVRNLAPVVRCNFHGDYLLGSWRDQDALRLLEVLREPTAYPRFDRYWFVPGPNSNGYARWVLGQADVGVDLDPRMVGKDWYGPLGIGAGLSPTRTGLHLDVLTFGATVGLLDGVEVHFLGATLGVDLWPPALKTPLGRLGF